MAGKLLLCLVFLCVVSNYSECKRYGSSSRSSGSSWGRGWGSSSASKPSSSWSSSGSSKPSQSSSSWFSSGSSAHKYPSSSSGLSGFGSSVHNYPSSSSGLSGFGSSVHNYPSSSSGLSGFGSSAPKYPSSSSGLSGFGSSAPKYPSSSSGLSGFGNSAPTYPSSSTGLSGFGSGSRYPSSSTGLSGGGTSWQLPAGVDYLNNHFSSSTGSKYPPSTGLSGTGSGSRYPPSTGWSGSGSGNKNNYPSNTHHSSNSYNTGTGHKNNYGTHNYGSRGQPHSFVNTPTYYTAPQHVYITEYRNSGSPYSDLLTGLALYNMGRSHSYHNHYYYNDDYYRRRYHTSGSSSYDTPRDEATCNLRIIENNKVEVLKIPCEIVSTFTEGSNKITTDKVTQTVCESNYAIINNTLPANTTAAPVDVTMSSNESTLNSGVVSTPNNTIILSANGTILNGPSTKASPLNITLSTLTNVTTNSPTNASIPTEFNSTLSSVNTTTSTPLGSEIYNYSANFNSTTPKPAQASTNSVPYTNSPLNITVMNTTRCTITDPLKVKGPPVNPNNLKCEVDIVTKDSRILRSKVDCSTLLQYSKMPEPKKEQSAILPSRSKLKSWISNPPWWLSLFIAV